MLELENITYKVGNKTILYDANATLVDHSITCLIGPNGIGKSTILNLITEQIQPLVGEIKNRPINIALLAQQNELFEPLTVRDLLTIQGNGLDVEVLMLLQLDDLLDSYMDELSGGQRQLVWLGYVLHQEPELLLLDEPTTYLDLKYQQVFLNTLKILQKKRQITVLMVLHDLTQAFNVSDNIWLVNDQQTIMSGTADELLDQELLSKTFGVTLRILKEKKNYWIVFN